MTASVHQCEPGKVRRRRRARKHIHLIDLSIDFVVFPFSSMSNQRRRARVSGTRISHGKTFLFIIFIASACGRSLSSYTSFGDMCAVFSVGSLALALQSTETDLVTIERNNDENDRHHNSPTKCVPVCCYFVEACRFPSRKYYFHKQHTDSTADSEQIKYDLITVNCAELLEHSLPSTGEYSSNFHRTRLCSRSPATKHEIWHHIISSNAT